jgi:hypothetical protein
MIFLALGLSAVAAHEGEKRRATPAQEYSALRMERQNMTGDLENARTDAQRQAVLARLRTLPLRFLELAEKNSNDPIALDALIEAVTLVNSTAFPAGGKDSPGHRALTMLRREHVRSDKLGPVCQQIVFGMHRGHETFLRAVLEANPHAQVRGLACLSLAQFLNNRLQRLDVLKDQDQPELAERYDRVFGKDYIEELQRQDRASAVKEIEMLFVRAAEEFGDVKIPVTFYGTGGTVREKAEAELFQIRHLAVGKVAPDIAGNDQEGKPFKLSDYRGKVVLLDFWYHL